MTSLGEVRLAVFDVDGTLIDSQHNIVAAVTEAWRADGRAAPEPWQVRRNIGLPLIEAIAALAPEEGGEAHQKLARYFKESFIANRQRPGHAEPLYPGALDALKALDEAGYLLGIATGKSRRGLDVVLERFELQNRFVTTQTGDDGPGKPNPYMLLRAMEDAGVEPGQTAMIGDTSFDILMAVSAGAHAFGVAWGYHEPLELREAGAHMVIERFAELPPALHSHFKGISACA
jgi:phosphoglycolate phosphatase